MTRAGGQKKKAQHQSTAREGEEGQGLRGRQRADRKKKIKSVRERLRKGTT